MDKPLLNQDWKNVKPGHEKLWIWQKAADLYKEICGICGTLPRREQYGLVAQIERSAKSVKDNIAEGNESYYFEDKKKGLYTARKEAGETQSHLRDFEMKGYLSPEKAQDLIDIYEEVKRGINGLIRSVSAKKELSGKKGSKRK